MIMPCEAATAAVAGNAAKRSVREKRRADLDWECSGSPLNDVRKARCGGF